MVCYGIIIGTNKYAHSNNNTARKHTGQHTVFKNSRPSDFKKEWNADLVPFYGPHENK